MKVSLSLVLAAGIAVLCGDGIVGQVRTQADASKGPFNMGPLINTAARDVEPTFAADGRTMYFNCADRRPGGGNDICVSTLVNGASTLVDGAWTAPEVVGPPISTEHGEVEPLLSRDGTRLYIQSNRPGGFGRSDLWVSRKVDGQWAEPENLGEPLNTAYADHCLYFAGEDEDIAYWTSTRPGGYGGNDIWTSRRVDGVWQPAVNLGPNVNSEHSDHHSLPSEDGRSLYVTSGRPGGHGGEDVYVTTRDENGVWSPLTNLGPLVNSDQDDRCPAFSPDYSIFYFDSERAGGFGGEDLWWIEYAAIADIR